MRQSRFALFLVATFVSFPALAASVTMLQFGSFETRSEAEKRLGEVKAKYAAQLGALEASVREVKLPPDNLTVYRTQAGPMADRAAAQSVCSKLAANGDECYIVQTAMVSAPTPAVASVPVAPAPTPMPTVITAAPLPERDPTSKQAIDSVRTATSAEAPTQMATAGSDYTATVPSPDMQQALDKAVAEQAQQADTVDQAVKDVEKKDTRSFWSRLNPFNDEEPAAGAVKVEPKPAAAPVDEVKVTPAPMPDERAPIQPIVIARSGDPVVPPSPAALEPPAPVVVAPLSQQPAPMPMPSAPVILKAEPMNLPPPPAPLKAQNLATNTAPKPVPVSTGAVPVMPLAVTPVDGNVSVEEAKRVPVTQSAMPVITQTTLQPPAASPVAVMPSASQLQSLNTVAGQKTLWAQVGPFGDGAAALEFWSAYRQSHPDFPVVRVRVTSPYQQQVRGKNDTWLRVGPMARSASVSNLCFSLGKELKLRCGQVTDIGIASSSSAAVLLPGSRYNH